MIVGNKKRKVNSLGNDTYGALERRLRFSLVEPLSQSQDSCFGLRGVSHGESEYWRMSLVSATAPT